MTQIKNLHLLTDTVSKAIIDKMEYAAFEHKRHSNITFKIVDLLPGKVIIQAVQEKSTSGNYFTQKRLIEIVHETFDRFFPGKKINVHGVPYKEAPCSKVTVEWVNNQMTRTGTTLKQLSAETDINYTQLSSIVSGEQALSKPMKALFWYYFLSKKNE